MTATRIKEITQTCIACPAQWEGEFEDGSELYIRYRWGVLSVSEGVEGKELYSEQIGDEYHGYIELDEVLRQTGLELHPDCIQEPTP